MESLYLDNNSLSGSIPSKLFSLSNLKVFSSDLGPTGTRHEDILRGTASAEIIAGLGDQDKLYGNDGDDSLYGNYGNDILYGGNGDDLLYGGNGKDTLTGGYGADTFISAPGDDGEDSGDTIVDFELGIDSIRVKGGSSAKTQIVFQGGNTLIKVGDETQVTLLDIDLTLSNLDDFINFF